MLDFRITKRPIDPDTVDLIFDSSVDRVNWMYCGQLTLTSEEAAALTGAILLGKSADTGVTLREEEPLWPVIA